MTSAAVVPVPLIKMDALVSLVSLVYCVMNDVRQISTESIVSMNVTVEMEQSVMLLRVSVPVHPECLVSTVKTVARRVIGVIVAIKDVGYDLCFNQFKIKDLFSAVQAVVGVTASSAYATVKRGAMERTVSINVLDFHMDLVA